MALKIACILGTRPEVIKLAPVIRELQSRPESFETSVISTAQHRQMLDQLLDAFEIAPNVDLDIMQPCQSLKDITIRSLDRLDAIFKDMHPEFVIVQGDTTTAFSAGLAAFYNRIPVGHVEAGLRSYDFENPYPEEMNRILLSRLTSIHFAPTPLARENLLKENISENAVYVTGNTGIDALFLALGSSRTHVSRELDELLERSQTTILLTTHRRENIGVSMKGICQAVRRIIEQRPETQLIFPVHLNPAVRDIVIPILSDHPRMHLIEPQEYHSFVHLMQKSKLILTDSGGIQEEAPSLGVPVLVLREVTERPEASNAGTAKVIGADCERIVREVSLLLDDSGEYRKMAVAINPYGDGKAAARIADILAEDAK